MWLLLLTECPCPFSPSCSVPSISVRLNGSTSVSSALAGKRVTKHPSDCCLCSVYSAPHLLSRLQVSFSRMFVISVPFPSAFVLRVSVCSGTARLKNNPPETLNKPQRSGINCPLLLFETMREASIQWSWLQLPPHRLFLLRGGLCNMTKYSLFHFAQSFFFRLIMVIFFFICTMPCVLLHRILRDGNTNKHERDTEW